VSQPSRRFFNSPIWQMFLPLQQPDQELASRVSVVARPQDNVENFAFVVDGAPEIVNLAADPDEDLVQMPAVRGPWPATADSGGISTAELQRSLADSNGRRNI
jgi:hypothetical protein